MLIINNLNRFMLKSLGLWGECEDSRSYEQETSINSSSSPTERVKSPGPSVKSSIKDEDFSEMSSAPAEGCGTAMTNKVKQTAANLPAPLRQV